MLRRQAPQDLRIVLGITRSRKDSSKDAQRNDWNHWHSRLTRFGTIRLLALIIMCTAEFRSIFRIRLDVFPRGADISANTASDCR